MILGKVLGKLEKGHKKRKKNLLEYSDFQQTSNQHCLDGKSWQLNSMLVSNVDFQMYQTETYPHQ